MTVRKETFRAGALTLDLTFSDGALCEVRVPREVPEGLETPMLAEAITYLRSFPITYTSGTPFTQRVWDCLREIPWGSAMTYREIAEAIGNPGATRAVGTACGANRLLLIVPCHRVIAENGLGGFGAGLDWKEKLIELETEPFPG